MTMLQIFTPSGESQTYVNARDLHTALAVGRDFTNWIKDRIETYGFVEGEDFFSEDFSPNLAKNPFDAASSVFSRGRPRLEYRLTLEMAKELALLENNATGRQVRKQLLAMERQLREDVPALVKKLERERDSARAALMAANPLWAAAIRYREAGLTGREVARLIGKAQCSVEKLYMRIRAAGLPLAQPRIKGPRTAQSVPALPQGGFSGGREND